MYSILFQKQIQFTRTLKAGGRVREFNFLKIGSSTPSFEVDVADERGDRHMFLLSFEDGWRIKGGDVPAWVCDVSDELYHQVATEGRQ